MDESPLGLQPVDGGRAGARAVQSSPPDAPCTPLSPPHPPRPCPCPPPPLRPFLLHLVPLPPAPSSPPLQRGQTPLHRAAINGHAPVVALLLATPGVDSLARVGEVRGAQRRRIGPPACPTPLPSAAGWLDSAGLGAEVRKGRRSRAAAGGPARRSGSRQGLSRGRRHCGRSRG